ncbi:MAG: hypothetical protein ACK4OM_01610 [Alphaproteobacteria bacterium]
MMEINIEKLKEIVANGNNKEIGEICDLRDDNGNIIHYLINLINYHDMNSDDYNLQLEIRNIIENLVKYNKELLNHTNQQGLNPLAAAVEILDVETVKKLIMLGADVNSKLETANSSTILESALYKLADKRLKEDKLPNTQNPEIIANILFEFGAELKSSYKIDLWLKIYGYQDIKEKLGDRFKFTQGELSYLMKKALKQNDTDLFPDLKLYTSPALDLVIKKAEEENKKEFAEKIKEFIKTHEKEAKESRILFSTTKSDFHKLIDKDLEVKIKKTWLNYLEPDPYPIIFWAIYNNNIVGLKALLANGANPNLNRPDSKNLDEAIYNKNNFEIVKILLEYGINTDGNVHEYGLDSKGNKSPKLASNYFDSAVTIGNPLIIRELMKYGARAPRASIWHVQRRVFTETDWQFFKSFFVRLKEEKYQIYYELNDYRNNYNKVKSRFDKLVLKRIALALEEMLTEGESATQAIRDNNLAASGKELVNTYIYAELFKEQALRIKNDEIKLSFKEKCLSKFYGKFSMQLYKAAKEIMKDLEQDDTYQMSYRKKLGEKIAAYNKVSRFAWLLSFVMVVKEYSKYNKRQELKHKLAETEQEIAAVTEKVIEEDLREIDEGQNIDKIAKKNLVYKNQEYKFMNKHVGTLTSFVNKITNNKIRPGIIAATEVLLYGNLEEVKFRYAASKAREEIAKDPDYKRWVRKVKSVAKEEFMQAQARQ